MAGLGPMAGQTHHFLHYAPEKIAYAIDRYVRETGRLYGVLNKRLADREFIAGDYSIADMACYPWVLPERQQQDMANFPHLARWKDAIAARPAVKRAYALRAADQSEPEAADERSGAQDPVRAGPVDGPLKLRPARDRVCDVAGMPVHRLRRARRR